MSILTIDPEAEQGLSQEVHQLRREEFKPIEIALGQDNKFTEKWSLPDDKSLQRYAASHFMAHFERNILTPQTSSHVGRATPYPFWVRLGSLLSVIALASSIALAFIDTHPALGIAALAFCGFLIFGGVAERLDRN